MTEVRVRVSINKVYIYDNLSIYYIIINKMEYRMLLFVAILLVVFSSIDCYRIAKISSISTISNMKRNRFYSSNLVNSKYVIKMTNNDDNLISSTSINYNNNNNNNNSNNSNNNNKILLKYSLITMSTILLMPIMTLAVDNDSATAFQIARPIFDISVNLLSFLFICRTVISWYPKTDLNAFPYNIAAWPTEPLLAPVRDLVPPAFGVDVSSIVWVAVLSFLREILLGQQGILTLIERNG